jgi:nucleotide-binding universal stress UspA family protein
MYTRILVPLDGSKLAECVLPHVEAIASGCGTQQVILISVTEKIHFKENINLPGGADESYHILGETGVVAGQMFVPMSGSMIGDRPSTQPTWQREAGKLYNQADKYLDKIQRSLIKKGLSVETSVLLGNPAEAIVAFAAKNSIDLIIMASHGRSGVSRWASGSVTDKVFRSSCVPVLMVRAPGCIPGF